MRIFKFFQIAKSYISIYKESPQDSTYREHADLLIEKDNYIRLQEMVDNGYSLNSSQTDKVAKRVFEVLFSEDIDIKSPLHANYHALYDVFLNKPDFKDLRHYILKRMNPSFSAVNIILNFDDTFLFKMAINAFNQKDNHSATNFEDKRYLKQGLLVLENFLHFLNKKNDKSMIKKTLQLIPIELHPYIYKKNKELPFYHKDKLDFHLSLYSSYEFLLERRESNNKNILDSQRERLRNLLTASQNYETFAMNFQTVKKTANKKVMSHEEIINSLHNKNKNDIKQNRNIVFADFDFSSIYNIPVDAQMKIKDIQSLYNDIKKETLNVEQEYYISKISNTVFEVLDNHELTLDFLNDSNFLIDSLDKITKTINNIKDNIEQDKLKSLSINHVQQKFKMS